MAPSNTVRRNRHSLKKRGGDFLSSIWPFGSKKQQPPGGMNWNQPTLQTQVNPIKTALSKYPLTRGVGTRRLIPDRPGLYRGPGILKQRNNSTQKVKKGITFNSNLHLSNGSTLPRAINSNNRNTRYFHKKRYQGRVYNQPGNLTNPELWSNRTNWYRSTKEIQEGINVPEFTNGSDYSRNMRNYYAHYATSSLYPHNNLETVTTLPQFSKKNNQRKRSLEIATKNLLKRNVAQKAQQSNINPNIEWKE